MGSAVAIFVRRFDAEQVVGRQLGLNPRERGRGIGDLHVEERAACGARELLEPAGEHGAVTGAIGTRPVTRSRFGGELVAERRVDEERVDRRVRARGRPPHLHAHRAEIRPPAWRIARNHPAADEDERLPARVTVHPRHEVQQHAEACRGLSFVIQRGVRDFSEELVSAVRFGVASAFPRHHRVQRGTVARRNVARHVDDLGRPQVKPAEPGPVSLPEDGAERPNDGGVIGCRGDLCAVRVGRQAEMVIRLQPSDELRDALDDVARRGRVEADAVDRQHDHTARHGRRRAAGHVRTAFGRVAPNLLCGEHPPAPSVDRHRERLGTQAGDGQARTIDDLDVNRHDVDGDPDACWRRLLGLLLLGRVSERHRHCQQGGEERCTATTDGPHGCRR